MFGDFAFFLFVATFIHLIIGCKKNTKEAPKSTPSETVKEQPKTPPPRPDDNDKKKAAAKPNDPKGAPKEINDNETINDAKSDWGELPK